MSDWTDPIQRATVWHVAGFAALGSVLVAGAQLSGFDWSEARHPLAAVAAMVLAIAAAAVIVVLGTRVLTPPFTLLICAYSSPTPSAVFRPSSADLECPGSGLQRRAPCSTSFASTDSRTRQSP